MKLFEKMGTWQIVLVTVAVIVLAGVSVMDVTHNVSKKDKEDTQDKKILAEDNDEYVAELEERLKGVLSKVDGVGNVDVMITLQASAEKIALKDVPVSSDITNEENSCTYPCSPYGRCSRSLRR